MNQLNFLGAGTLVKDKFYSFFSNNAIKLKEKPASHKKKLILGFQTKIFSYFTIGRFSRKMGLIIILSK